jgi:putative hydrolase of the HAD superfamily
MAKMEKKYEHIFFDLDKTLWDFDENSKKILIAIFINFKLHESIDSVEAFIDKYQEINENLWSLYRDNQLDKETLRWKRFEDTLMHFNVFDRNTANSIGEYYELNAPRQTLLFPNSIEVLDYLSKKYQLHIITNGIEEEQHIKLSASGLTKYFDVLVFSEKVGVKKPHPYIFKKAFSLTGAKARNSIMIGDDLYADIYGAQRVNMDAIYFNSKMKTHDKYVQYEINCLTQLFNIL